MSSSSSSSAVTAGMATVAADADATRSATTTTGTPEPAAATTKKKKLHGRAFYESIGSPKYVVAPMVDQSEFAWRMLSRSFLPEAEKPKLLAYTPMFHARLFAESAKYRETHFQAMREPPPTDENGNGDSDASDGTPFLDGNPALDRPLFVQFCANDPAALLAAARLAAPHCDAVDLNLGCPQGIARKGHYGAFLQEDQELIFRLIRTLHEELSVPVTAKIRVLDTPEATLAYARNVLAAGASILAVHGRRRDQKGHYTGLADWRAIRFLRDNLPPETVLFANGNVLQHGDLARCLAATGADAVMSAEGNLSDPAIFAMPPPPPPQLDEKDSNSNREYWRGRDGRGGWRVDAIMRRYLDILHRYALDSEPQRQQRPLFLPGDDTAWLDDTSSEKDGDDNDEPPAKRRKQEGGKSKGKGKSKSESPNMIGAQAHLFHLLRHLVSRHTDVRDALGRARLGDIAMLEEILDMVERKVARGLLEYERMGLVDGEKEEDDVDEEGEDGQGGGGGEYDAESSVRAVRACKRPWWIAQPIVRPLPKEAMAKGAITLKKDKSVAGATAATLITAGGSRSGSGSVTPTVVKDAGVDAASLEKTTSFPRSELVSG